MTSSLKVKLLTGITATFAMAGLPTLVSAQSIDDARSNSMTALRDAGSLAPEPVASSRTRIDYSMLDEILLNMTMNTGPSTREIALRPNPRVGTRIVAGHKTAYRLEGNKVMFSYLKEDYQDGIREYRKDLEAVGSSIDLTRMSRDEQLAYWLNLHNVALIEAIIDEYPAREPSKIQIKAPSGKVPLYDAKLVTVKDVPLSLRDIREKIVLSNWNDERVIYGFFRGDIGSPAIQNYAFTGDNVWDALNNGAEEFVNSLRGMQEHNGWLVISEIYREYDPWIFEDFETDLRAHMSRHVRDDVRSELDNATKGVKFDNYDTILADLTGGYGQRSAFNSVSSNGFERFGATPEVARMVTEIQQKREKLYRRELWGRGVVTIVDVDRDEAGNLVDSSGNIIEEAPRDPREEGVEGSLRLPSQDQD